MAEKDREEETDERRPQEEMEKMDWMKKWRRRRRGGRAGNERRADRWEGARQEVGLERNGTQRLSVIHITSKKKTVFECLSMDIKPERLDRARINVDNKK